MAKKVMYILIKILLLVFIVLLFVELFVMAGRLGYRIFSDEAKDSPEVARETIVVVEKEDSLLEIGKILEEREIVDNAFVFAISLRCMNDYEKIKPGEYDLFSSERPSEILKILTHKEEAL